MDPLTGAHTTLSRSDADFGRIAADLDRACAEFGFFYVTGHGIDPRLSVTLQTLAQQFFALPAEEKLEIAMTRGGRAWRGYFPLGGELTSGRPDRKEGIYFGTELATLSGTYGDYLLGKVAKVFPDLGRRHLR